MSGLTTGLNRPDPIVLRRRLCGHLVTLRGSRTQREVAEALDWSPSKLLRIENGSIGISTTDLKGLLAYYEVANQRPIDMLVHWAKESRHQITSPYSDVLDPELVNYLRFEASAVAIRQYNPYVVPGLLQTEEYARSLITALAEPDEDPATIDRQVEARLSRQAVIGGSDPASAHFVLDEAALRRPVAPGPDTAGVMRRQLAHIDEVGQQDNVTVRLLPMTAGVRRGGQWPLVLLDFADDRTEALLYLEGRETRLFRDDPAEIARHESVFQELATAAMEPAELVPLLASGAAAA